MKILYRWALLACLLLVALASYSYGFSHGAIGLVIAGVVLELIIWFKAFSVSKHR